jgi:hypothetical protein
VATTPRPTRLIGEFLARKGRDVTVTRGSTYENRANLAPGFFDQIIGKYEGTRLGRQELDAEALSNLLLAIQDQPGYPAPYRYLAACYAHMGHLNEGHAIMPACVPLQIRLCRAFSPGAGPRIADCFLTGLGLAIA